MYVVTIGEKDYHIKDQWEDYTVRDSIELFTIIKKAPKLLTSIYQAKSQTVLDSLYKKITHEHEVKTFPNFYGKMICAMSDIPASIMKHVLANERADTYKIQLEPLVIGMLHLPNDYTPKEDGSFEIGEGDDKETLLYPKSVYKLGDKIPFGQEQAIGFTEVADLEIFAKELPGGKYERAANIMSVICRPEKEEYDEETSLKRAPLMLDLPMPIMWDVFFWLIKYMKESVNTTVTSSTRRERRKLKRLRERG